MELYSKVGIKVKITITIQLQQVFNGQKMIAKCFTGENRDMQNFSWNLDNLKFEAGFEPEPINCKPDTLATRPYGQTPKMP